MIKKLYSMYDRVGHQYMGVITVSHLQELIRLLKQQFQRKVDIPYVNFPAEFELHRVGEFDDETGEILPVKPVLELHMDTMKGLTDEQ